MRSAPPRRAPSPPPASWAAATGRAPTRPPSPPCARRWTTPTSAARSSSARESATRRRCSTSASRSATRMRPRRVDIAVDPLEGTNLVATGSANATAVLAAAEPGGLMHAPDTYLEKLIVGPMVTGHVSITDPVAVTLATIAARLGPQRVGHHGRDPRSPAARAAHRRCPRGRRPDQAHRRRRPDGRHQRRGLGHRRARGHGHRRRAGGRALGGRAEVPWRRDPGQVQVALGRGARARPRHGRRRRRHRAGLLHRTTSPRATTSSSAPPA